MRDSDVKREIDRMTKNRMNHKIKELALLCGAWDQVYENEFGQRLLLIDRTFDYPKFAKLLVQECHNLTVVRGVDDYDEVMEYFGLNNDRN